MAKSHTYHADINWTGNQGEGTKSYQSYTRDYDIEIAGKAVIAGSADPNYLGDASRHNPEDLLLAAVSSCHMLWYLHFCTTKKIVLTGYRDHAQGTLELRPDGGGKFTEVVLRPVITVKAGADLDVAAGLHSQASEKCFIAQSVNFPVRYEPEFVVEG